METLTGFKWIARAADNLGPRPDGLDWRLVFGYEEALGFACNDAVRDKDGISAAVQFVAMCRALVIDDGSTPIQRLGELMDEFGLHRTDQVTVDLDGRSGSACMDLIRAAPPDRFGAIEVARTTDFGEGVGGLYPADVLRFDLADGSRVSLRPQRHRTPHQGLHRGGRRRLLPRPAGAIARGGGRTDRRPVRFSAPVNAGSQARAGG